MPSQKLLDFIPGLQTIFRILLEQLRKELIKFCVLQIYIFKPNLRESSYSLTFNNPNHYLCKCIPIRSIANIANFGVGLLWCRK